MERTPRSVTTNEPVDAAPAKPVDRGILDVVLALHRSPVLRFDLRERPLPADLDLILHLAAPSQPLLDDTAKQRDVTPSTLREAGRFYLQQVLFEPGTDAYRVLGVAPDAPFERIREHHQWLQRWLHPDRSNDEGFAPFAAKLNWAWQQLRNERKRNAYDAERAQADTSSPRTGLQPVPARSAKWTTVPVSPSRRPGHWWRRGALLLAFGSCVGLFVLALIRNEPTPIAQPLADAPMAAPTKTRVPAHMPAPAPVLASTSDSHRKAAAASAARPQANPPAAPVATAAHAPKRNAQRTLPTQRAASIPVVPATHASERIAQHAAPAERATSLPVAPKLRRAAVMTPVAAPILHEPVADTRAALAATPVELAVVQPAAPSQPLAAAVLLQRVELARARVDALVAYFRSADAAVPGWHPAPAPFNAPLQRAALRQRTGLPSAANFALDTPIWRVTGEQVGFRADYQVQRNRAVIEHGRFQLQMVWRDDAWEITHIELEPHG